jgi:hypothetical protein
MLFSLCSRMMASKRAVISPAFFLERHRSMGWRAKHFASPPHTGTPRWAAREYMRLVPRPEWTRRQTQLSVLHLIAEQEPPDSQCKGDKIWNLPD